MAETISHSYAPTDQDTKFFSESLGISYAESAGFSVEGNIASRPDMPGVSFHLLKIGEDWRWVRR